jgi:Family of unknown function (DUF6113)
VRSRRPVLRGLTVALLVPLGFVVGVAGSFVQAMDVRLAGGIVPWGVALAIASTWGLLMLTRAAAPGRLMLGLVMLAWLLGVIPFTIQRPEGDIVIPSGVTGFVFLVAGVLVAGVGLGISAQSAKSVEGAKASDTIEAPLGH